MCWQRKTTCRKVISVPGAGCAQKKETKILIYLEAGGWFAPELSAITEAGIVEALPIYSDEV